MARRDDGKDLLALWQDAVEEDGDILRRLVEHVLNEVLEAEITEFLGAEPDERTEGRRGYRNGHYERTLTTRVGKVELLVPRDRKGRFSTELFERYQRSEKALVLSLMQMYVQGVSTRKVKKITQELCGIDVSKSQVSQLAQGLDEQVEAWRSAPIEQQYRYLVVDALFEKVRHGPQVLSDAVLVVTGISEDGYRQHLGVWMGDTESKATWSKVFEDLKDRGLEGVRYVVSDRHRGIEAAVARQFQGAVWQRCQVHFKRNVFGRVRRKDRQWVMDLLGEVTDASTLREARDQLVEAVEEIEEKYPDVAQMLDEEGEEMLGVYALPEEHRKRMRSTNMLERWFEEIRRRTRVVRIFPNRASCVRLIGAHCMEANEEWLGRRYLTMEPERIEKELAEWLARDSASACELASVPSARSHADTLEV
jgi:transposase-like protein